MITLKKKLATQRAAPMKESVPENKRVSVRDQLLVRGKCKSVSLNFIYSNRARNSIFFAGALRDPAL